MANPHRHPINRATLWLCLVCVATGCNLFSRVGPADDGDLGQTADVGRADLADSATDADVTELSDSDDGPDRDSSYTDTPSLDLASPDGDTSPCVPEGDDDLCGIVGAECGAWTGLDGCGDQRTLDCGSCVAGDVCEANTCRTDSDGDGVADVTDNCPMTANPAQPDGDGDGYGDSCDDCQGDDDAGDADADGFCDDVDVCPSTPDPGQVDADTDGHGDLCDNCPDKPNTGQTDSDGDGFGNGCDNCPNDANPSQTDTDGDGKGDVCDTN